MKVAKPCRTKEAIPSGLCCRVSHMGFTKKTLWASAAPHTSVSLRQVLSAYLASPGKLCYNPTHST